VTRDHIGRDDGCHLLLSGPVGIGGGTAWVAGVRDRSSSSISRWA
jgi:hypothetical protein